MPHRELVVYLAIGDAAHRLASFSIGSLRKQGYTGDVAIVGDASAPAMEDGVRQYRIPEFHLNTSAVASDWGYEFDCRDFAGTPRPRDAIQNMTPETFGYVDVRSYDLVLQMDVDVLAARDLGLAIEHIRSLPQDFGVSLNKGKRLDRTPASSANLSRWERYRWRHAVNINSGIFFVKPSRTSMNILRDWRAELCKRINADQAALQAIYLRKWRDRIAILGRDFQEYPVMPHRYEGPETLVAPGAFFAHFRGAIGDPTVMVDYARKFGLVDPALLEGLVGRPNKDA